MAEDKAGNDRSIIPFESPSAEPTALETPGEASIKGKIVPNPFNDIFCAILVSFVWIIPGTMLVGFVYGARAPFGADLWYSGFPGLRTGMFGMLLHLTFGGFIFLAFLGAVAGAAIHMLDRKRNLTPKQINAMRFWLPCFVGFAYPIGLALVDSIYGPL